MYFQDFILHFLKFVTQSVIFKVHHKICMWRFGKTWQKCCTRTRGEDREYLSFLCFFFKCFRWVCLFVFFQPVLLLLAVPPLWIPWMWNQRRWTLVVLFGTLFYKPLWCGMNLIAQAETKGASSWMCGDSQDLCGGGKEQNQKPECEYRSFYV